MLGVDIGGTFTDVVAVRDGRITVTKVAVRTLPVAIAPMARTKSPGHTMAKVGVVTSFSWKLVELAPTSTV